MQLPPLADLQRRRVFRALVGYAIAAFAVLQMIEPIMHGLHWPDGVISYVVAALAVGFPLVVGLAWIFDVKAAGILQPVLVRSSRSRLELLLVWIAALAAAGGCSTVAFLRRSPGLTSARPWLRGPRTRSSVGTHIRAKAC